MNLLLCGADGSGDKDNKENAMPGFALRILWSPRSAAQDAARSNAWLPMLLLALTAAFAEYPLLLRLGSAGTAQIRLDASPEGMTAFSILAYVALRWAAPVLLLLACWVNGRYLCTYAYLALDNKLERRAVVRISAWGFLPLAAERLLVGILSLTCRSCNRANPLASNLAFVLDAKETPVFWYEMARGVDIFSLWAVCTVSWALAQYADETPARIWPALAALWLLGVWFRAWLIG